MVDILFWLVNFSFTLNGKYIKLNNNLNGELGIEIKDGGKCRNIITKKYKTTLEYVWEFSMVINLSKWVERKWCDMGDWEKKE